MLHQGEILGVAGVDGNGQRELAEVIAGQRRATAGEVMLFGAPDRQARRARARRSSGLRYVTDDRLGEGIVGSLGVGLNLVLKRIGQRPFWRHGPHPARGRSSARRAELVAEFDVRTPERRDAGRHALGRQHPEGAAGARALLRPARSSSSTSPPTGSTSARRWPCATRIRELAADGVASLVISTDLEELLGLCDRIAVLYQGRLVGTFENGPGAAERIGELMVGSEGGVSDVATTVEDAPESVRATAPPHGNRRPRSSARCSRCCWRSSRRGR